MATREPVLPEPIPEQLGSFSGCLARIFWMAAGNVVLFFFAAKIFARSNRSLSWMDAGYWLVVVAVLVVRYADVRYLQGHTANGAPATLRDWGRYAFALAAVAAVLWGAAHLLG